VIISLLHEMDFWQVKTQSPQDLNVHNGSSG